jgi:uncharacterized protein (DUF1015 family)
MPHVAGLRGVVPEASKIAEVLQGAGLDLAKGLAAGSLVRDPGRAIYRYHQTFAGPGGRSYTRKSLFCVVRLAEWSEGAIRPHEATTEAQRAAALAKIRANGAHTEAVLCGVRDAASEVDRLFRKAESGRPTFELTTADGTVHKVWRAQDAELIGKLRNYFTPKKLHLLEGHDRYEGMLAYRKELGTKHELSMYSAGNYGLACIVPMDDPALFAAARHRVIRGVTVKSGDVLAAAKKHFIVEKLAGAAGDLAKLGAALADTVAHQPAFVAVFAGEADAWKLTLSPEISPIAEGVKTDRALQKLDPIVVEHLFVERHLEGAQVTTEIDAKRALATLGEGANVALIVRPLSAEQIAHVDELGQLLPAQSTAFHPPIAAGLVSFVIDPDEDVA